MSNILHVVHKFFVLPFFIGEQFKYFDEKGHTLHVICSQSPELEKYSSLMHFSYYEIEITRSISPIQDLKAIIKICKYIKNNEIDIVVGHTPKGALLSIIAAWIMRVPKRIYFRHGLVYETMKGLKRKLMINLDRLTALCATQVVCVSPSLFQRSIEDKLNKEKKQTILKKGTCTGIDSKIKFNPELIREKKVDELRTLLNIDDDTFVIGYCGRLVCDKGIIDLVEAFLLLTDKLKNNKIKLLLVGGFEERDALPNEIMGQIKNHSEIIYTGWIYEGTELYYSLMDVFVLPSYREGFPTSILEASSMNLPVITTKVTGCIDAIIEDVTGIFVSNESSSIAAGIEFYLNNPETRKIHGKNGRAFVVKNFDQKIIWKEIEELYK